MSPLQELKNAIIKQLEALQSENVDVNNISAQSFQKYFQQVQNDILTKIENVDCSPTNKKKIAEEIISYLKTNIQQYPHMYRSFLWGHIKSWEFESQLVNNFINILEKKYEISHSSMAVSLWHSFTSTCTELKNGITPQAIASMIVLLNTMDLVAAAKIPRMSQFQDNCLTPERESFLAELFASRMYSNVTDGFIQQAQLLGKSDVPFISGLIRQDDGSISYDWCLEGTRALFYYFTGDEKFYQKRYQAIRKIIRKNDDKTFAQVVDAMEKVKQLFFPRMPEEYQNKLLQKISNYHASKWIDLNLYDPNGAINVAYPLEQAIIDGSINIVELLLKRNVNLNANLFFDSSLSFLSLALRHKKLDIAELLMKYNVPLYAEYAYDRELGGFQEFEALINYNDPNFEWAKKILLYRMKRKPLSEAEASALLLEACNINSSKLVKMLIELTPASSDFSFANSGLVTEQTPFLLALMHQNIEIIKLLLPRADLNKHYYSFDNTDFFATPLSMAYSMLSMPGYEGNNKAKEIIQILIKSGANELPAQIHSGDGFYTHQELEKRYSIQRDTNKVTISDYVYLAENLASFIYMWLSLFIEFTAYTAAIWGIARVWDMLVIADEQDTEQQKNMFLFLLLQLALYFTVRLVNAYCKQTSQQIDYVVISPAKPESFSKKTKNKEERIEGKRQKKSKRKSEFSREDVIAAYVKSRMELQQKELSTLQQEQQKLLGNIDKKLNQLQNQFECSDELITKLQNLRSGVARVGLIFTKGEIVDTEALKLRLEKCNLNFIKAYNAQLLTLTKKQSSEILEEECTGRYFNKR